MTREHTFLIIAVLFWSSLHPVAKLAVWEMSPAELAFLRAGLASAVLLGFCALSGRWDRVVYTARRGWRPVAAMGMLGFLGSAFLSMTALTYLPASVNTLLSNTTPLFVAVGAAAFLREPVTRMTVLGLALGFTGVGLLAGAGPGGGAETNVGLGVGIALVGSVLWAFYTGLGRQVTASYDPVAVTGLAALSALPPLALAALLSGGPDSALQASSQAKLAALWSGVVGTGFTYVAWSLALRRLQAASVASFQYLIPLLAVVIALVLLGEHPTLAQGLGMLLVLGGVASAQRHPPALRHPG